MHDDLFHRTCRLAAGFVTSGPCRYGPPQRALRAGGTTPWSCIESRRNGATHRILAVEAGQVVCPRRGIVDLERCWVCPAYDGLSAGRIEGVVCKANLAEPDALSPACDPMIDIVDASPRGAGRAVRFPGVPAIVDGSEAIAHVETRVSEVACAYPITPSTTMAAVFQSAVAAGHTNLWGTPLAFIEPESEHSSASAAEGVALAGGRVTNFTAGQGLILMKEVLYVLSGKRLPVVFHVGARALTSQALNIHAGHDDVMGIADTGWGILFARNAQEAADLSAIARRVAEETHTPFFVVQDGFLTTHTLENVQLPEDELLRSFVGDPRERIDCLFDPDTALMTGVVQNQDSYMKGRIGQRAYYAALPSALTRGHGPLGRRRPVDSTATSMRTAATMPTRSSSRWGPSPTPPGPSSTCCAVKVERSAPSGSPVIDRSPLPTLPRCSASAKVVAVVERTDEPAAADNPLTRETKAALYARAADGTRVPRVVSVSAGLGSRDVDAADLAGVFDWSRGVQSGEPHFGVVGVRHPLAVPPRADRHLARRVVRPPRPFDRRSWVDHHEQVARDGHGRGLRQAGPGIPAVRVGEEGPPDELLADHRRRADPRPRRAAAGRPRLAPRRLGIRAG